jgi:Protein of unknown function (DUF3565)
MVIGERRSSVGFFQHVRHDPPLTTRQWVLTEGGRASRVGFELDCKRCDEEADNGREEKT